MYYFMSLIKLIIGHVTFNLFILKNIKMCLMCLITAKLRVPLARHDVPTQHVPNEAHYQQLRNMNLSGKADRLSYI